MRHAVVVTAVGAFLAATGPAQASCIRSTERENIARADAVFTGRVVSGSPQRARAVFEVLRVRKGRISPGTRVRVYADPFPSSITINWAPRPGQRWRVYVQRKGSRWVTSDCLGTRRAS